MLCDQPRRVVGARRLPRGPVALAIVMAVLLAVPATARAQDASPPQLESFVASPAVVDVTAGPATVTFTARFTDDESGFESADVVYVDPNLLPPRIWLSIDADDRVSGDALDGTYQVTDEVAQFSKAGVWTVIAFSMRDVADNVAAIPPASLPSEASFEVVSVEDTGPPTLAALSSSPPALDVTTGPGGVTVTAQLLDDVSGVDRATVTFESPSATETASVTLDASDRISGDALDGVYEDVVQIPQLAENGLWSVESVRIVDVFGYVADLPAGSLPPPGPPTVSVTSSSDGSPPQLVELLISPTEVNLGDGPVSVVFISDITDDVTGVANASILLQSPVEGILKGLTFDALHRISGDSLDGVYIDTVEFTSDDPGGFWTITFFAHDAASNSIQLSGGALPGQTGISVFGTPPPPPPVRTPLLGPLATGMLLASLTGAGAWSMRCR